MKVRILFYLLLSSLLFSTIDSYARDLATIKRSGKIFVGMTKDDINSINYNLAVEFAKYLNVELVPVDITWEEAFMKDGVRPADLETNPTISYTPDVFKKVDIICSTFTVLEWRKKIFDFAETLNSAELLLISKKSKVPKDFSELAGKSIAYMKGTSFEASLKRINDDLNGGIRTVQTETSSESKDSLKTGKVFGIILDADEALAYNVENGMKDTIALPISPMTKTAWVVEKGNDLAGEVEDFFSTIESNEVLDRLFRSKFKITYSSYLESINKIILLEKHNHDLGLILEEGKLVVGVRDRNFIYRKGVRKQFMHVLAEQFADYLGITPEYLVTPYLDKYWETQEGKIVRDSIYSPEWFDYVDLAADVFVPAKWQKGKVNFIPLFQSDYIVVSRKDRTIKSSEDLKKLKCVTIKGSAYEEILTKYGLDNFAFAEDTSLLSEVESGKADYTILYDAFYELSDYPDLEFKISLGKADICWAIRKDQPLLTEKFKEFAGKSQKNGLIKVLMDNSLHAPESAINKYYENFQPGQFPSVLYGAEKGLPQEDIFSIFQDRKGYMWFGSCAGAIRYNAREMKTIGNSRESADNRVFFINQDTAGIIYLATAQGILVIDRETVKEQLFRDITFRSIYIDSKNDKWFVGNTGIYILKNDGSQIHLNKDFPILPSTVYNVTEDSKTGDKYISTSEGIFVCTANPEKVMKLTNEECYFVFIDVHGHVWTSTREGVFAGGRISDLRSGNRAGKAQNLNSALNLDNDIIKDIRSDKYGSVWLIFDTKIIQMTSSDHQSAVYDQASGLKSNRILSALFDREDNLWVGFFGGLQRVSYRQGLRNFFPSIINSYVYSVKQTDNGRIWIASNNGVFYYDDRLVNFSAGLDTHKHEFVGHNQKFVMEQLPNKNLVFACSEGIYEVDPVNLKVVNKKMFDSFLMGIDNIFISSKGEIYLLTGLNGIIYYLPGLNSTPVAIKNEISSNVSQLYEMDGRILGGNSNGIFELKGNKPEIIATIGCKVWSLFSKDSILWAGTDNGLVKIINENYKDQRPLKINQESVIKSVYPAKNKNYLWLGTNSGFAYFNTTTNKAELIMDTKDGLSGDEITPSGLYIDRNDLLWIGTYHGISNFSPGARNAISYSPLCYIERSLLNGKEIDIQQNQVFRYNQNNFIFEIAAVTFSNEESNEYEFYIRGTGNEYSTYNKGKEYKAYYNNLPPGKYEFLYQVKAKDNVRSYSQKYVFTIRKAWYNTWLFRISASLLFIFSIWGFYRIRIRTIEEQKKKLEQLVKKRTLELEKANVEIEAQRDLAASQRDQIAEQNKEITDSIYYAERIQRSLLPPVNILAMILPEHFILFKPRDIVSGDFYWAVEKGETTFIAAVDCTGHGVPGALMSMLGISFLNEIINKTGIIGPEEILNQLRESIIKAMKQVGHEGEARDGMDISLVVFDRGQKMISFAGANNPLYFVRNGELQEIKGDKMPVGIYEKMVSFTRHNFDIQKGDTFYLFSDGYADQFGGPKGKKFMYSNFKNLLVSIQPEKMAAQGEALNQRIEAWMGDNEQIDDIVVIGLRF